MLRNIKGFHDYRGSEQLSLADVNECYYKGDTLLFWKGKIPKDETEKKHFWEWLERAFHSYNIIQEGVDHYVSALVGQDFTFTVEGENKGEAEEIIKKWLEWQKQSSIDQGLPHGEAIKDAVTQMFVRDEGQGKGVGYLRLAQPEKYQFFKKRKGEEYKSYILHSPCSGSVFIERDDSNYIKKIIHSHGQDQWEYELDNEGKCVITKNKGEAKKIDLAGKFPIFPVSGKCLISNSAKQIQNSINEALTMKDVNVESAGFRQFILSNVKFKKKVRDTQHTGKFKYVDDPNIRLTFGAGSVIKLEGLPIGNQSAPTDIKDPGVDVVEPVDIKIFVDSVHLDIETFYFLFKLAHLLSAGDGSVSGKSRTAIQRDYVSNLHSAKDNIEGALSNAMQVLLIHLDEKKFRNIRVSTNLTLSFDLIPELITMYVMMIEAGLIAKETVMKKLGNPNAEEELEKILQERKKDIESGIDSQSFVEEYNPNNPKKEPVAA
ncbi:MAG: hypothetical protein AB4372_23240 [Xenococcus sp. (in: cyanobacteria)]